MKKVVFSSLLAAAPLLAMEVTPAKVRLLYNTLDQQSVAQHLALYELYPGTVTGQQSLSDALELLCGEAPAGILKEVPALRGVVDDIINLVNKQAYQECPTLSEDVLRCIENLAAHLPHKKLKGHQAWSEAEVLSLSSAQIDLARGLLLSEVGDEFSARCKIRSYEAMLDLMALQIIARLPVDAKPIDKIRHLNDFIFFEMGFRFPPHSQSIKDIDLYSFLPSVIDSRKGVCLGVSILYICLAQRLQVPLEIITPPGHIFVRYHAGSTSINIETTARGIHLDDELYLNVDTRSLQTRTMKETIGMVHFNQAAVFWQQNDNERAIKSYLKAKPYLPDDMLLKELMGYNYLLTGQEEKGRALMAEVKDHVPDFAISKQTVAEDYLAGRADVDGIRAIFMFVDERRESLLKKKEALQKTLEKNPQFRAGLFSLAGTWLQLHRLGEALETLEKYHQLDPTDPCAEYYLAELYAQRMHYSKAWDHLRLSEKLTHLRGHHPKALKTFRQKLSLLAPEYRPEPTL